MRDREAFKALIEKKQKIYEQRQRKNRRRLTFLLSSAAVCIIVTGIAFSPLVLRQGLIRDEAASLPQASGTQEEGLARAPVSAEVTDSLFLSPDLGFEETNAPRRYTAPAKTQELLSLLEGLTPVETEITDDAAEAETVEPPGRRIEIAISFQDGAKRTYTLRGGQYLRIDGGEWMLIKQEDGMRLEELLARLAPDE